MKATDGQVRKLMVEMAKHGRVGLAAMRAGLDRKTARKYVKGGKLPSETVAARTWRTRPDCRFPEVLDPGFSESFPLGSHRRDVDYLPRFASFCPALRPGLSLAR